MATVNTWIANVQGVAYGASKHMMDVFNATSSTRYIRIYKAVLLNNGTAAITGVLNQARINALNTSISGGSTNTPIAMDTSNAALNANTTSGNGRTTTVSAILRQIIHSPDEPVVTTLDWDAMGTLIPFGTWWDIGYGDTTVQAFACRASENRGMSIQSITQTVGTADCEMLFTDAAS